MEISHSVQEGQPMGNSQVWLKIGRVVVAVMLSLAFFLPWENKNSYLYSESIGFMAFFVSVLFTLGNLLVFVSGDSVPTRAFLVISGQFLCLFSSLAYLVASVCTLAGQPKTKIWCVISAAIGLISLLIFTLAGSVGRWPDYTLGAWFTCVGLISGLLLEYRVIMKSLSQFWQVIGNSQ